MGGTMLSLFLQTGDLPWVWKSSTTISLRKSRYGSFFPVLWQRSLQAFTALTLMDHV